MAVAVASLVFLSFLAYRTIPTVEGPAFTLAAFTALVIGPFLYVFVVLHTYRLVGQYREILRQLAMAPMAGAYQRLPLKASFTYGRFLSMFTPRVSNLRVAVQQYEALTSDRDVATASGEAGSLTRKAVKLHGELKNMAIQHDFETELLNETAQKPRNDSGDAEGTATSNDEVIVRDSQTACGLVRAAQMCVTVLTEHWQSRTTAEAFVDAERADKEVGPPTPQGGRREPDSHAGAIEAAPRVWVGRVETLDTGLALSDVGRAAVIQREVQVRLDIAPRRTSNPVATATREQDRTRWLTEWLGRAEELVALVTVTYVSQFALHVRNNLMFMTACPLLLLVAVNSYPFQPHRLLALFLWTLSLATLLAVTVCLVTLDRDELLSRIAKSRPAYFDWASVPTIARYVVPLIGVLITQHPDVSDFLYAYFGPLLRVIEK
jgi:hypothetical protein